MILYYDDRGTFSHRLILPHIILIDITVSPHLIMYHFSVRTVSSLTLVLPSA